MLLMNSNTIPINHIYWPMLIHDSEEFAGVIPTGIVGVASQVDLIYYLRLGQMYLLHFGFGGFVCIACSVVCSVLQMG